MVLSSATERYGAERFYADNISPISPVGLFKASLQSLNLGSSVFYLHLMVEVPASINFFLNPSGQFESPAPWTHSVIRQYAILLFVSCVIALIFAFRNIDRTSRNVAGALALYHIAPLFRAFSHIMRREEAEARGFGGSYLHFVLHLVCMVFLLLLFMMSNTFHEPNNDYCVEKKNHEKI
ncbi:hypothetical protein OnM2_074044 [Erysiphe neolycopersici]|uniref:Uncharacterized protein n=1 Tax=Erysiphe neolycopersici TaxID=212602 RepID=A0A420HJ13_9PEZI|nr:hypothetical protein OnM2_074044 [Erysiphe neolycopersici]